MTERDGRHGDRMTERAGRHGDRMTERAGRTVGLDVGERRIGVAVTDPLGLFARPLLAIDRTGPAADAAAVGALVEEWQAARVVVGLPYLPSGESGEQAERVERFVDVLRDALAVPVETWDESYSTVTAAERLGLRGPLGPADRGRLDAAAAAVILESWLEAGAESGGGA